MPDVDITLEGIESTIARYQEEISEHSEQAADTERELMGYLFQVHQQRIASVDRIASWLGIARQTVYNKWKQYGFDKDKASQTNNA